MFRLVGKYNQYDVLCFVLYQDRSISFVHKSYETARKQDFALERFRSYTWLIYCMRWGEARSSSPMLLVRLFPKVVSLYLSILSLKAAFLSMLITTSNIC